MTDQHYRSMDGIRSVAVIVIVFFHALAMMIPREYDWASLITHWIGLIGFVYLFVLSGYLMTLSTERMFRDGKFNLRKFTIFRSARIFPAYLLSVLLVWFIGWISLQGWLNGAERRLMGPYVLSTENFIRDLVFLFNKNTPIQNINGPVWSLRLELVCYVILALAAIAIAGGMVVRVIATTAALALAAAALLRLEDAWIGLVGFSAGIAAARWPRHVSGLARYPLWTITFLWGIAAFFYISGNFQGNPEYRPWSKYVYVACLMVASAAMIAPPLGSMTPAQRFFMRFEKLAAFSYTLYITHYPIMILSTGLLPTPVGILGKAAFVMALVSAAFAFSWPMGKVVEARDAVRNWLDRVLPGQGQVRRRTA
jgi:peptidoglycan/LPS O-acetylase OafA/YrhL